MSPAGMDRAAALESLRWRRLFQASRREGWRAGDRPIVEAAVLQRGRFAHQPRHGHAGQHQRVNGLALAGGLQRLCRQLVASAAAQRRVTPQGTVKPRSNRTAMSATTSDMVARRHTLGFVVQQVHSMWRWSAVTQRRSRRFDTAPQLALTSRKGRWAWCVGAAAWLSASRSSRRAWPSLSNTRLVARPPHAARRQQQPGHAGHHQRQVASPPRGSGSSTEPVAAPSAIPTQMVTVREPGEWQSWSIAIDVQHHSRARPRPWPPCSTAQAAWPKTAVTDKALSTSRCSRPPKSSST
mgnify:CR=1 FL=1